MKLRGYNRHTVWPESGAAVNHTEIEKDIEILVESGSNYVRGGHYQQDQYFLDLCDEKGIVVWEEGLSWENPIQDVKNPVFFEQHLIGLNEMISASFNHPSIIFFGFFNELDT